MTEVGEGTLLITYAGTSIAVRLLGKAIGAALNDISKGQTKAKEVQPENAEQQDYTYSSVNDRADIKEVASEFRGYDVDFAVLKNPSTNDYLLFFKANDSATIEKAMFDYLDKVDRELQREPEKTPVEPETTPQPEHIQDGPDYEEHEYTLAAETQETADLIDQDISLVAQLQARAKVHDFSLTEREDNLKEILKEYTIQADTINKAKGLDKELPTQDLGLDR